MIIEYEMSCDDNCVDMIIDWKEKNRVFRSIWNESRMNIVIEIGLNWWDGVMWYEILLSF